MAVTANTPISMRSLPVRPSMEHLKNEAKQHLQKMCAQQADAKLSDAQTEVARRYGFTSWRALRARVAPTKIEMRALAPLMQVFDMPASIAFYRDILGFSIVQASRASGDQWIADTKRSNSDDRYDWAMLRLRTITLMLNTAYESHERPSAPDGTRVGAHRDLTLFFSCPSVDDAYAYLRSKGVETAEPFNQSYGRRQVFLKDPDGYGICFQERIQPEAR